ncbi:TRI15 [Colletotrichum scovillei]|uniref:TRI15 protein n=1 Tax=Colletotrichum scovillei TaxID=1209932 RepID=A0A9P7RDS5_9PEZI|nr:TRI15 [Colletotrichum scovillei]KAF4784667.1 TRI15 [Colletotrichum scovillei]KAG7054314.1 TRI15 protein [Colletotrichum scovillei]KAG7072607.1 TRI15 protein [Colletotrichum scovillei]KAG7080882.1 TRI15 protein [Colletotrichum scovillei]
MSELSVSRSIPVAELQNPTVFLSQRLQEASLSDSDVGEYDTESSGEDTAPQEVFNPSQCLFCNELSTEFAESMLHMQKRHGLSIPNPESLIVDLETLVKYCHLVMVEYKECLYCGSVRNTAQAVRQHMTGKSHCRIEIGKPDSEFRDFYDLGFSCGRDSEDNFGCRRFADSDEDSRELASGKVVSHRNGKKAKNHRKPTQGQREASDSLLVGKGSPREDKSTALTASGNSKKDLAAAADKRDRILEKRLATLRVADRQVLSHLPLPQQRALVAKAKKQQETWNSEQMAQKIKIQMKAR